MNILLPVDGSECSNKTLTWVAKTFDKGHADYYLLHVIPIIPDIVTVDYDIVHANEILEKAKTQLEVAGCPVIDTHYVLGDAATQICQYATVHAIDQVVIGSHGRSGIAKLLLGSTSEAVLEHCPKNVIVYRNVPQKAAQALSGPDQPEPIVFS
jgi:nucleotide-binding universal stress UspA family protein